MSRLKATLCIAVLTMSVSSTVLGGTIVGARASRSGTIVGARGGTIVGARSGNIAGTSSSAQPRFDFTVFVSRNMAVVLRLFMESSLF
jgi:hypothetical protein